MGVESYFNCITNIITTARDDDGVLTESPENDISCRFHPSNKLIMNKDGKEVKANARLIYSYTQDIDYLSKVQLVSIDGREQAKKEKKFPIQSIRYSHGFTNSHLEVYI